MDGRGRLAQPLKPTIRQGAASPRALSAPAGRWHRLARRWLTPVIDNAPPRGVGIAAVAALMIGSAGYGIAKGGHAPVIAGQIQEICDAAANAAGFRITRVALEGNKQLTREEILGLAGIRGRSSLLFLDAASARARLEGDPWIAEARIQKLYPGELRIEIKERAPFAIWQKAGDFVVIAADGTVLESYVADRFKALPVVVGRGADRKAREFLEQIARYGELHESVRASVLVAERRWSLHLHQGIEVMLPEAGLDEALDLLAKLARDKQLLSRDIVLVDLRLPDRVTVRLTDGAAQARAEVLKPPAAQKPKRKGGDA